MSNVSTSKPSKWLSNKSFKLTLPVFCRHADVANPNPATAPSSTSQSKRRVAELREVFRHFDGDQDGKISSKELKAFFASIGEGMSAEEAEAVISDFDSDGDRLLDFQDFLALMERDGGDEEDLRKAFEAFEVVKGSGRITPRGLQHALSRLGDEKSVEQCEAMIRAYDLDGNGELDFHEFHLMMR